MLAIRSALPRVAAALVLALSVPGAAAEDVDPLTVRADDEGPARVTRQERPFAFLLDPTTPTAGVLSLSTVGGLSSGLTAARPIPVNFAASGFAQTIGLSYGATDRLAPFASVQLGENGDGTLLVGGTLQLTPLDAPLRLSVTAAGLHEGSSQSNGIVAIAALSLDQGAWRLAANLHGERVFAAGRDGVDVLVLLGTSYRIGRNVRFGAEYVGQDVEETFGDAAEGGARHVLGPTAALDLEDGRYQVVLGSAFGLTARSPRTLLRAAVSYNF